MSSNSKEFSYELIRKMHNDIQTQIMRITQSSQAETAATATNMAKTNPSSQQGSNPQINTNSNAEKPTTSYSAGTLVPAKPQPMEKKTFEQAYREAIDRINAAAGNRNKVQQQLTPPQQHNARIQYSKSSQRSCSPPRSIIKSTSAEPSVSVFAAAAPGSSEGQYKTTIYNINTINLAGLVKSQQKPNDGQNSTVRSDLSTTNRVNNSSSTQYQKVERVMDESNKYRETFANAYARHLLEITRTAVQKKTDQIQKPPAGNKYTSSVNQSTISSQIVPLTNKNLPSKKPKLSPAFNSTLLNGKDGAKTILAEMLSNGERKPNGNVTITGDRKTISSGTYNPNAPSHDAMMAAHSSKSKFVSSTPIEKTSIEPRLKPSSIKINHEEFYRQIQNKIEHHAKKIAVSGNSSMQQPIQEKHAIKSVAPREQAVIISARSTSLPTIGYRPDLTVIVNKPKISSPAPSHVYGKPTISSPSSTSSTGQSVSPTTNQSYSMGLCTPKRNPESLAVLVEPPPAHSTTPKSSFISPQTSIAERKLILSSLPTKEPASYVVKNINSISPKLSKLASTTAADGVLNLDVKIPFAAQAGRPSNQYNDYSVPSTNYRTPGDRSSILFNNSQKMIKIEKRVNYDHSTNNKVSSLEIGASKYQHSITWKEQPSIKQEINSIGLSGKIYEQKKTLLELLQNANMQQGSSNSLAYAKSTSMMNRAFTSVSHPVLKGALQTNHLYKTNQDLFKYRMANKSLSKEKQRKLVDPLAIKPVPDRPPMKRKDPAKRLDLVRRKKPKLARSTDPYLQHGPCHEVAPRLSRCRECGRSAAARSKDAANIFCRFIAFRKLRYNEQGQMEVAGFADPNVDAQKSDTRLWDANLEKVPIDLSVEKSKFLLGQVGYKFCELFHQEKEAYFEHMSEDKTIAWKQAVNGVREMCDVCSTTLFNYHWVCSTCGFVVCIDCYKCRKYAANNNDTGTRDRDGYMWLHCSNREPHVQNKLMLTQIIPSNSLYKLVRQMHGVCALLEIPLNCECPLSKESLFRKIKDRLEFIYPITVETKTAEDNHEIGTEVQENSLILSSSSTTKMISITIKNIESFKSKTDNAIVCCKAIFGRELSEEKNPALEKLKHKEKQSYSFNGFQEEIKIESLEDFINKDEQQQQHPSLKIKEECCDIDVTKESSAMPEMGDIKVEDKENSDAKQISNDTTSIENVKQLNNKDPLAIEDRSIDEKDEKPDLTKDSNNDEPTYSDEHRFKASPKLDWKTFNMIVKQLLKFDKSLNISGLFEKHLSEKYSDSKSLVDFTAEFQVQHSNIKSFLNDFLSEFVFLTGNNKTDNLTDDVQIMEYNKYMKKGIEFQNKGERTMSLKESETLYPNVAHQWLCNGRLLRLLDPLNDNNYIAFHDQWERGQPVMVSYVSKKLDMKLWHPQSFIEDFGDEENDLINCLNGKLVRGQKMKIFWDGFEKIGYRLLDERDRPMMLKLKDWPPGDDFAEMMPTRFNDLMSSLPLSEYTRREGRLNLASRLSSFFVRPDLGPKMYSAYGSALHPTKGTTNLHLDVSDAVNVMVYVAVPEDVDQTKYTQKVLDAIDSDECDVFTRQRIRDKADLPGALWHIFHAKDADKIRSLLNKIEVERGGSIKPNHDPIHDQKWYLDTNLRKRLLDEYNVEGYSIVQCSGDAIFIPAGAPHQVRNLHNCVKVAEDFVSPENIAYCFKLTNEFRHLTNTHSNHEDKLQIKNIIYHTVKDAVSCLTNPLIMTKDEIDLM